jgi:hypothetical protein
VANAFTSTLLLASLKRRGLLPTSEASFTAADFYKVMDEEMQTYMVPLLMSVREEYLVVSQDITVTAGTTEYYIPERAIGGRLRDVTLSGGNDGYYSLTRLEPENIEAFTNTSGAGGYYLRGNQIVLSSSTASGTLRVTYYQRPNRVVATTAVGEITAIAGSTVTIAAAPSTFTTTVTYDFVKGKPGFDTLGKDFSASAAGTSMVFTSSPPTGLAVGDFVCLSQETPIPQLPVELHPLLAQRAAAMVLRAVGNPKAEGIYKIAEEMEARALKILTPRTDGSNRKVVNKFGVGRGTNSWRW